MPESRTGNDYANNLFIFATSIRGYCQQCFTSKANRKINCAPQLTGSIHCGRLCCRVGYIVNKLFQACDSLRNWAGVCCRYFRKNIAQIFRRIESACPSNIKQKTVSARQQFLGVMQAHPPNFVGRATVQFMLEPPLKHAAR